MQNDRTDINLNPKDLAIAHLLLRLLIGINFFNSGLLKIVNFSGFIERTVKTLEGSYIPEALVRLGAYPVPIIEFIVGILICLGLSTRIALIVTSALMLMLMMGVSSAQKPEIASNQLIYGIVLFILLSTIRFNLFSIDRWIYHKRKVDTSER